jgi:hypothetical protein
MAGFHLIIYGCFWVITEAEVRKNWKRLLLGKQKV